MEPMENEAFLWRERVVAALQAKTHPQQRVLRPFDMKRLAEDRGFWVAGEALESWDKQGVFHPLLRVSYPFSHHRAKPGDAWPAWEREPLEGASGEEEDVVTVVHEWSVGVQDQNGDTHPGVHPAVVEVPTTSNFTPWRNYQSRGGEFGPVSAGDVFYHPYQIFRLSRVVRGCECGVRFLDFTASAKTADFIRQNLEANKKALEQSEVFDLKVLLLLLRVEDRYLPLLRGGRHQIHLTGFGFDADPQKWFDLEKSLDARRVFDSLPFSIEEIMSMREHLAREGWNLDPNRSWFELLHHIPYERRQRLRGDALFAWDYYEAAEVIGTFLRDVTGEPQAQVDDLLHGGHWKKDLYGIAAEKIDYHTGNALREILARFTIDPRIKVLLMVEGASEVEYIRVWCREQALDLDIFGVRLFDMNGVPGGEDKRIRQVIEAAQGEGAAVVVVMDNENKAPEKLRKWLAQGLIGRIFSMSDLEGPNHPIGGMVWEASYGAPCFEEANFSPDELILALGDLLEAHPKYGGPLDRTLLKAGVEEAYEVLKQQRKASWFGAMKRAGWKMHFPLNDAEKPELAACLARRFGLTNRPIHRLIHHVQGAAVRIAVYGPVNPQGGYGLLPQEELTEEAGA